MCGFFIDRNNEGEKMDDDILFDDEDEGNDDDSLLGPIVDDIDDDDDDDSEDEDGKDKGDLVDDQGGDDLGEPGDDDDDLDDPDDGDGDDDGDDDDGDDKGRNRSKHRINQLTARQRAAERERDAALEENAELRDRLKTVTIESTNESVTALEDKQKTLVKKLTTARDEGNSTDEVEIEAELRDVHLDIRIAKDRQERLGKDDDEGGDGDRTRRKPPPGPTAEGTKWLAKNGRRMASPDFNTEAKKIDIAISREGELDPNTPEYFDEMDRRLKSALPAKYKSKSNGKGRGRSGRKGSGGSNVASPTSQKGTRRGGDRQTQLTAADKKQMRTFQLDPNNKEHKRRFLAERRASENSKG